MKNIIWILFFFPVLAFAQGHEANLRTLYTTELKEGHTYENLRTLCKEIGNRLSGSPARV